MTVDILLATYNGLPYLENQLLSLQAQTHKDWKLIVHDDGSNDGTLALVKSFALNDSRISIIDDNIQGLGAAGNFIHLLKFSTSPYIIFCDQDDIWFENKLSHLLETFSADDQLRPAAVFCNGYAYSIEKGIFKDKITTVFPKRLEDQLFLNAGIQGCSLMFNSSLKEKLNKTPDFIAMHDHFITLGIACFGTLKYFEQSLMLYRQNHENKATSNINTSINSKIKGAFFSSVPVVDRVHYEATLSFFNSYKDELDTKKTVLFNAYFDFCKTNSLIKRLTTVIKHGFNIYNSVFLLALKTLTRKGIN